MNKKVLRVFALLLAVLLVGCNGASSDQQDSAESTIPTGRYVEEQLSLPPELLDIKQLKQGNDGTLYLFGSTSTSWTGPWGLWVSRDDGSTWSRQEYAWIDALNGARVMQFTVSAKDECHVVYEDPDSRQAMLAKMPIDSLSLQQASYPIPSNEFGLPLIDLLVAQDGNLILVYPFEIFYANGETGEVIQDFNISRQFYGGEVSEHGGTLYLAGQEDILLFDLETGKESGIAVISPFDNRTRKMNTRIITVGEWDGAVYYCDFGGLYRTLPNSPATELLLSGEQSILVMPTMKPQRLLVLSEDRYLILGQNGMEGNVLYRYIYDPDMPSEPSVELRVFSLDEAPTIRQAIGTFQREVPTVKVTYQVGRDENSGITAEDALRALTTEILAGAGPDILVLDGMPVATYAEKGVLMDMSGEFDPYLKDGNYLNNVVDAYRVNGELFAIPARFTAPMILAPDSAKDVNDLQSLADWMEEQESPKMKYTTPEALLEQFFSMEYDSLFQADGYIDEEGYIEFLNNLARLSQCEGVLNSREDKESVELSSDEDIVAWAGELTTVHIGELDRVYTAAFAHQAMEERGGTYHSMGDVYVPRTILGINEGGTQKDLAVGFVNTALSEAVLSNDLRDGLPANMNALKRNMENPNPTAPFSDYWFYWEEIDVDVSLEVYWPEDTYFADFLEQMSSLQKPVLIDVVLRPLIWEQSLLCLEGKQSPEDAVKNLKEKVDLIAAE